MKVAFKYLLFLVGISVIAGFLLCLTIRKTKTEIKPIVIRWPNVAFFDWAAEWDKKWPRPLYFEGEIKYIDSTTPVGSLPIAMWSQNFSAIYTVNDIPVLLPMKITIGYQGFIESVAIEPIGSDSLVVIDSLRQQSTQTNKQNFDLGLYAGADVYPDIEPQMLAIIRYKRLVLIGRGGLYKIENQGVWQMKLNGGIYFKLL